MSVQRERAGGRIMHPQRWPRDLDWTGKRVVVIGRGGVAQSWSRASRRPLNCQRAEAGKKFR